MSEACSHNCSSCGSDCSERTAPQNSRNDNNKNVKKVIAVVSGKGGVGKSLVTSLLAVKARQSGLKTAILEFCGAVLSLQSEPQLEQLCEHASLIR